MRGLVFRPFTTRTAWDQPPEAELGVWQGTLVPRISIKTYNLLLNDSLQAWITFSIPREMLPSCEPRDSLLSLSRDMGYLLKSGSSSADALILTADGDQLPAHLAIIRTRSSLLTSSTILNESKYDIGIMVDGKSPATKKLGARQGASRIIGATKPASKGCYPPSVVTVYSSEEDSSSSGFDSNANNCTESDNDEVQYCSPKLDKRINFKTRTNVFKTPTKQMNYLRSPSRTASSERLHPHRYPRSPLTKAHLDSPSKKFSDKKGKISKDEVVRDLNQCFIECSDKNLSLATTLNSKPDSTELSADDDTFAGELKNFDHLSIDGKLHCVDTLACSDVTDKVLIKVNMSTSVTKQFLEWIYTGQFPLVSVPIPLFVCYIVENIVRYESLVKMHWLLKGSNSVF